MSDTPEPLDASRLFDRTQMSGQVAIRTLLLTDFVDSTAFVETVGDSRASDVFGQHDRLVRDLVATHGGREIDKTDGFLLVFRRPVEAVEFALSYHEALDDLTSSLGVILKARAAIHLGEVQLRANAPEDVERGAKPVELEGLAKPTVARIMTLAAGGQTLLSDAAFEMARRASVGNATLNEGVKWLHHGPYQVKGVEEALQIYEVGRVGGAPLSAPVKSDKAWPVRKQRGVLRPLVLFGLGAAAVLTWFTLSSVRDDTTEPTGAAIGVEVAQVPDVATQVTKQIEVTVESVPTGATIRADDEEVGTAPAVFSVDDERDELSLVAELTGFRSATSICVVDEAARSSGSVRCSLVLEAIPPPSAKPRVASKPPVVEVPEVQQPSAESKKRKPKIDLID